MDTTAAEQNPTRVTFVGLLAQAVLAFSIAIAIAVTLGAAVLLLAGAAQA